MPMPVQDCSAAAAGVLADGARAVDRATVLNVPTSGHYIALAVKPPSDPRDTGDYHFWRLDADNTWSYKAGDTLSRNTYRNGTALRDIEEPEARGQYTQFCGYYEVSQVTASPEQQAGGLPQTGGLPGWMRSSTLLASVVNKHPCWDLS